MGSSCQKQWQSNKEIVITTVSPLSVRSSLKKIIFQDHQPKIAEASLVEEDGFDPVQEIIVFPQNDSMIDPQAKLSVDSNSMNLQSLRNIKLSSVILSEICCDSPKRKGQSNSLIEREYDIGRLIGSGSYGVCYKITHKITGQCKAMKQVVKSQFIQSEIEILKDLDHPHIVRFEGSYSTKKYQQLIFEFLEGQDLQEYMKNSISEERCAQIIQQILLGVRYLHQKNIIHRDIKAENIVFMDNLTTSHIKIIDFGTARLQDKPMTLKIGTLYYMAPEMLEGSYTNKVDIWAVGVLMYMMMNGGQNPFTDKTEQQIANNIHKCRYKPLSNISKSAQSLLKRFLLINPTSRPSAQEALNDEWFRIIPPLPLNHLHLNNITRFPTLSQQEQIILILEGKFFNINRHITITGFDAINASQNGLIDLSEFNKAVNSYQSNQTKTQKQCCDFFKWLNRSYMTFSEYCIYSQVILRKDLSLIFKCLDHDQDGFITSKDIDQFNQNEQLWELIQGLSSTKDGKISAEEFKNILNIQTYS